MVDCLWPFLKIACLQLPIQVFKEWIDRLGFSFFPFLPLGQRLLNSVLVLTALMYIFASKFNDRHRVCNKMSTSE